MAERMDQLLTIRARAGEKAAIGERAKRAHVSVSRYLVACGLGEPPPELVPKGEAEGGMSEAEARLAERTARTIERGARELAEIADRAKPGDMRALRDAMADAVLMHDRLARLGPVTLRGWRGDLEHVADMLRVVGASDDDWPTITPEQTESLRALARVEALRPRRTEAGEWVVDWHAFCGALGVALAGGVR